MKRPAIAILSGAMLMAAAIGQAQVINVSAVSISETDGHGTPTIQNSAYLSPQGWSFKLGGTSIFTGSVAHTFTLKYTVSAAAGYKLTGYEFDPLGSAIGAHSDVKVDLTHKIGSVEKVYDYANQTHLASDTGFHALNQTSYNVTAVVTLKPGTAMFNTATLTNFNVHYTEQAVPEPAAIATVLFGISGLLVRRPKRSK